MNAFEFKVLALSEVAEILRLIMIALAVQSVTYLRRIRSALNYAVFLLVHAAQETPVVEHRVRLLRLSHSFSSAISAFMSRGVLSSIASQLMQLP